MKFYIALLMCLVLSGCGRCWHEVCTHSCESWHEQNGSDPSVCSADTLQDGVVEVGDITVEDVEDLLTSDAETLDDSVAVPTVEEDVEN